MVSGESWAVNFSIQFQVVAYNHAYLVGQQAFHDIYAKFWPKTRKATGKTTEKETENHAHDLEKVYLCLNFAVLFSAKAAMPSV